MAIQKRYKINHQIQAAEVRVIGPDDGNIGVLTLSQAIAKAQEMGLDLIAVSELAKPPVCKIADYNKYVYDQKDKEKKQKVRKSDLKEFVISPKISEGDLQVRLKRAKEFLEGQDMVKFTVKFKGREKAYPKIGETKLKIVESELAEVARVESPIKFMGSLMSISFMPKKTLGQ